MTMENSDFAESGQSNRHSTNKELWRNSMQEGVSEQDPQAFFEAEAEVLEGLDQAETPNPDFLPELEVQAMKLKQMILGLCDTYMSVIYVRALLLSKCFNKRYREALGTKEESNLQTLVRCWPGRPVEMVWRKRKRKIYPASPSMVSKCDNRPTAKSGCLYRIIHVKGEAYVVKEQLEFLKRGTGSNRYPISIFKDSPAWVQILGNQVEEQFACLRTQIALLREIRNKVYSIDTLDDHIFERLAADLRLERHALGKLRTRTNQLDVDGNEDE